MKAKRTREILTQFVSPTFSWEAFEELEELERYAEIGKSVEQNQLVEAEN